MVFQHVGLLCIIKKNKQYNFEMDLEDTQWMYKVPWNNTTICTKLNCQNFKDYFKTGFKYRCDFMYSVDAYYKEHVTIPDYSSSGGVIPMPSMSSKQSLLSFGHTINFIGNWPQCFEVNYHSRIAIFKINKIELFRTIPK